MTGLDTLTPAELLERCTGDAELDRDSLPVLMSRNCYLGWSKLYIIDGQLVGTKSEYDYLDCRMRNVAELIRNQYAIAAKWLHEQGFIWLDSGSYRYVVRIADDLVLKAPLQAEGERQIILEATHQFPFPVVDSCEYTLPNGVICLLQDGLRCTGRKYEGGYHAESSLPPVPTWTDMVSDGGQVGWSDVQQQWVAYDMGNEGGSASPY